ncbi:MAG TPA: NAD(P)/FAD-dependent oxidoreductase [Candidatus Acidoferrales bacterium]|nr:NAD(P)/FAD-dependent oxidoreductase [Candidatus Acidoferrales bacterium]
MSAKIVILGGGFGGLATAARLERLLGKDEAEIALVSRENFSLFTPMVPEVSSGGLELRHVVTPVRAQLRRTQFYLGEVKSIDLAARTVDVEHTILQTHQRLPYDHLVFALGSVTSTFGLPGIEERALPLKTLEDAERLRNQMVAIMETADVTTDPVARKRLLTFVFVGGGFTGVEAAGEMLDFFRSVSHFYRTIDPKEIEVVLIEGGHKLLPDLQAGMGEYSAHALSSRGVRVMLDAMVAGADADGINLKSGEHIATATIVWSAGVKPAPLIATLGLPTHRGAVVTNPDMSIAAPGHLWAIGDCAAIPAPGGSTFPATAQHAIREGPVLAANIVATLRGRPTRPFRYDSLGMMASLGGRRGVAGLGGKYLLTGFIAWVVWRTYYLARLPGIDRRLRVTFDWTLGLIFPRDIAELRVYTKPEPDTTDQYTPKVRTEPSMSANAASSLPASTSAISQ